MTGWSTDGNVHSDAGEREYTHVGQIVSGAGETFIHTPAAGKRIRLWWVYALNNPSSDTPRSITVKIGTKVHSVTYGVSKRQKFTGGVNDKLIIELDGAGDVAVTAILEEI